VRLTKDLVRICILVVAMEFGAAVLTSAGPAWADAPSPSPSASSDAGSMRAHPRKAGKSASSLATPTPKPARQPARQPKAGSAKQAAARTAGPPSLRSVVDGVTTAVTSCACKLLKSALVPAVAFIGQLLTPAGPRPAPESPAAWTVLAWVRKQVDDTVATISALPGVSAVVQTISAFAIKTYQSILSCAEPPPTLPAQFVRTTLASGLTQPTDFRFLPDGRILITEKAGAIRLYENGALTPAPLVTLPTQTSGERGLLGIEVDPHFTDNGYIYVTYTDTDLHYRLSRLTVSGDTIDPASELTLFRSTDLAATNHQGGDIHFGPDGMLYWGVGDNGVGANAKNLANIRGKILRLDPADGSAPQDNPFVGVTDAVPQIWAYGLRNPFRFTFTPQGQLLVGDVGQDSYEELDIVTKGGDYGWPDEEGFCGNCTSTNPIFVYAHTPGTSAAITSVLVYDGGTFGPSYQNKVFIADYTQGWLKVLTFDGDFATFVSSATFDGHAGSTVKLAQGPDGNIYALTISPGTLSVISPAASAT